MKYLETMYTSDPIANFQYILLYNLSVPQFVNSTLDTTSTITDSFEIIMEASGSIIPVNDQSELKINIPYTIYIITYVRIL